MTIYKGEWILLFSDFSNSPYGRKRHFPGVPKCIYPALKRGTPACNLSINEIKINVWKIVIHHMGWDHTKIIMNYVSSFNKGLVLIFFISALERQKRRRLCSKSMTLIISKVLIDQSGRRIANVSWNKCNKRLGDRGMYCKCNSRIKDCTPSRTSCFFYVVFFFVLVVVTITRSHLWIQVPMQSPAPTQSSIYHPSILWSFYCFCSLLFLPIFTSNQLCLINIYN